MAVIAHMSFAFHGFQSWLQYSNRGMTRDFKSASIRERFRYKDRVNTHLILSLVFLILLFKVKSIRVITPESDSVAQHYSQISDSFFEVNISIIICFLCCCCFYLFIFL